MIIIFSYSTGTAKGLCVAAAIVQIEAVHSAGKNFYPRRPQFLGSNKNKLSMKLRMNRAR